jgi:tetraacyldisaccharide 4'-kinase
MSSVSRFALAPLSAAYGAAVRARLALHRRGKLRVERVAAPVLSIGNLTAGGTGKTPLVEWLARAVAERESRRVCVLTRGYGRADARRRVIVSDGTRVIADARAAGDEPLLLAEHLRAHGGAVICDADRVAAARFALERLGSCVFILDDGFQHLRLARDLNVVTIDATDPWGGGRLLPAGLLREPAGELKRADCVVITRAELSEDLWRLREEVSRLSSGRPIFAARTRTVGARPLTQTGHDEQRDEQPEERHDEQRGEQQDEQRDKLSALARLPRAVAAFCGVGNPRAFFANLRREGFELRRVRAFADHHDYTQSDVEEVEREARRAGAELLLTTAKDAIKLRALRFELPCYAVEIELQIDDEGALMELVHAAIAEGEKSNDEG